MAEKMSGQDGGKNGVGGVKTFVIGMREDGCCSQKWRGWSGKRREVREKMAGVGGAESEEREERRWLWKSRSVRDGEERQSEGKALPLIEAWAWSCSGWVAQRSSAAASSGCRHQASLRTASPRFQRAI